jgi:hypothetical protein
MKEFTKDEFIKLQKSEGFESIPFNIYAGILKSLHEDIQKAEKGDITNDGIVEMAIIKAELGTFEPVKVLSDDFVEHFFVMRKKEVEFETIVKGEFGEIIKADGGTCKHTSKHSIRTCRSKLRHNEGTRS